MANPYQTALMSRLNPNKNTGVSGIYSDNGQVNAPPMQAPGFVETPPEGPPPTLGTGNPTMPPPAVDTKAPADPLSFLSGFEPTKLNPEHAKKSPKYAFGTFATDFDDTPEGLRAMSQDPRFAAAGFQMFNEKSGKIFAPDPERGGALGVVDVGNSFGAGGNRGWQWGAEPEISAEMPTGGAPPMVLPPTTGGFRTQDFQDADNSGVDDRDEPQQPGFDSQSPYLKALLAQLGL